MKMSTSMLILLRETSEKLIVFSHSERSEESRF